MLESCHRALELGLGGIAFTEHADLTDWILPAGASIDPDWQACLEGGTLKLPALEIEEYMASVQECRRRYPGLTILSGVEISEPHWHPAQVAGLLAGGRFDRVLSSVHAGSVEGGACEVSALFDQQPARDVVRGYLAEVTRMIQTFEVQVLAHIDYAVRYWPEQAGRFDPADFEVEHRQALGALAASDGTLEINTRLPLDRRILSWWVEAGGRTVTLGSDSHAPQTVAAGLHEAADLARSVGFHPQRPGRDLASPAPIVSGASGSSPRRP